MGLAAASFLGQGDISPSLWAVAPRRHPHYSEVQVNLATMHPAEDLHLRIASFMVAPHDPSHASAYAFGLSSELPSLWWGPRGLFTPLLPMSDGSRSMARGHGSPPLCDIRGGTLELPIGGVSSSGRHIRGEFLPRCGQFGFTEMRSFSGASPHPAMPRGFIFPGTEAAYASQTMYPYFDRPWCHTFHRFNGNWGHRLGCTPPSYIKKKPVGYRWVFTIKNRFDRTLERYKA